MDTNDPRKLVVAISQLLHKLKIPYMITGGIAVLVWGRPRFTADIDVVVELEKNRAEVFQKSLLALGKAGYLDRDAMMRALENEGEFNFIHGESGVKVDFWTLKKSDDFDVMRLARRKARMVFGQKVYFIAPEDLILKKLQWHKESGSPRQLEDVESILKISGAKLDFTHIKKWAAKLGVSAIFDAMQNDHCPCDSGKKYKECHGK